MTPAVLGAVLGAAVLHATWNAMAKRITDQVNLFAQMGAVTAALALGALFWVTNPARASWPWLVASVAVHLLYTYALLAAYRLGDFNQTYPIARGLGPLVVTGIAATALGEVVSAPMAAGITLIAGGVALLGLLPWRKVRANRAAVAAAVLTGLAIATYTVIDGVGVRRSGSAAGYTLWLMGLQGVLMAVGAALVKARRPAPAQVRPPGGRSSTWSAATAIGLLSVLAYGLVLWAQTHGALAAVAALRESSVVVAAVIGSVLFGESMGRLRMICSVAVCAGAVLLAVPNG